MGLKQNFLHLELAMQLLGYEQAGLRGWTWHEPHAKTHARDVSLEITSPFRNKMPGR